MMQWLACLEAKNKSAGLKHLGVFSSNLTSEVKCFCCTNGHRHPQTGQKLSCDRELAP